MAKIHNIGKPGISNPDGGGGNGGDVDLASYATIAYSDAEDVKVKQYVDQLGKVGKEYVDAQIEAIELPDTEINLEGYAKTEQLVAVDEASLFRDAELNDRIDEESDKQTASTVALEAQIVAETNSRKDGDEALQAQINELSEHVSESEPVFEGSLRWVEGNWNTDNLVDAAVNEIKIHEARTHMVLNHDTAAQGRVNWETKLEPYPATIGLLVEDVWYWAVVEYLGNGGQSGRGKNFKIIDHNLPATGVVPGQTPVAIYSNYTSGINLDDYATVEYSDSEDEKLQGQVNEITEDLDDIKTQLGVILEPETDTASYMFIGDNQWVSGSGKFSANLEKNRIATFLFHGSDFGGNPVDFDSLNPGDILYFQNPQIKQQQEERSVEIYESVVHTWVVERIAKEGDLFRIWVANEAKSPFETDNLYDMQIHHKGGKALAEDEINLAPLAESIVRVSEKETLTWAGQKQAKPQPGDLAGWAYKSAGDGTKAHWTLWSQVNNAHRTLTLKDILSYSLVITGKGSCPFLQVYTKRKNDGQDAANTYRIRSSSVMK